MMNWFLIKFSSFTFGCFVCHYLTLTGRITPALSAAIVGLSGSFLKDKGLQNAVYAGAFAGMCNPTFYEHPLELVIISALATILYFGTKELIIGFGGMLGTISFLSCLIFFIGKNAC